MNISFYIPVFNGKDSIDLAIVSVMEQTLRPTEIIVIDDASTDGTRDVILRHNVNPVLLDENRGLGHARNMGWRTATGEIVASCDADVVLDAGWTQAVLREFDDPKVAGAGGKLTDVGNDITCAWRRTHMAQHWGDERIVNPRFLFGANTAFRKSVLEEVGGYNESFRTNNEDVDICERILKKGYTLVYTPAAQADHIKRTTIAGLLDSLWRWYENKYSEERHFCSISNLCHRVEKVNFGIFRYKTGLDLSGRGPESNLAIDLLIPFRMTLRDLVTLHAAYTSPVEREMVAGTIKEVMQSMLELLVGAGLRYDCACWMLFKMEDAVSHIYALDIDDMKHKLFAGHGHADFVSVFRRTMSRYLDLPAQDRDRIADAVMDVRGQGY